MYSNDTGVWRILIIPFVRKKNYKKSLVFDLLKYVCSKNVDKYILLMSMARDYTHPFQLYDVHDTIPCKGKIVSMVGPVRSFKRKSANITFTALLFRVNKETLLPRFILGIRIIIDFYGTPDVLSADFIHSIHRIYRIYFSLAEITHYWIFINVLWIEFLPTTLLSLENVIFGY